MKRVLVLSLTAFFALAAVAVAAAKFSEVKPQEFDPGKTELVQAAWVDGIGCPTNAVTYDGSTTSPLPAAGGCPTGDEKDKHNQGLLLAKTGPTSNFASATATLKNVKGITVTELGFDLRKPTARDDPRGSHCGGGAPRFNVYSNGNPVPTFIGCDALTQGATGDGWMRLRWNGSIANVDAIEIIADEGQDVAEDEFGVSILDNIDVNGTLVGQGPKDSD